MTTLRLGQCVRRRVLLWGLLLLMTAPPRAKAQIRISGAVSYNAITPVMGANVSLEGTYDGSTTDKRGEFSFVITDPGTYTLLVEAPNLVPIRKMLMLKDSVPVKLKLIFVEKQLSLSEVMVRPRVFANSDKNMAGTLKTLDVLTTATDGSINTALKSMPGTQQVGESADLFVRGGTGYETKTFMDGLLIRNYNYSGASGVATRSRYPTTLFKGTVFSTGGYSAQYGQALSSVLLLETQDIPIGSSADFTLSPLMASAAIQQVLPDKKSVFGGGLNYTNLNWVLKWMPNQSVRLNPAPESLDGHLYYRRKLPNQGMFKMFANWSWSETGVQQANLDYLNTTNKVQIGNRNLYANINYRQYIGKGWKTQLGAAWGYNADDINIRVLEEEVLRYTTTGQQRTQTGQAKAVFSKDMFKYSTLHLGTEWFYTHDHQGDSNSTSAYVDVYRAAFAELDWYLTEQISLRVGGRYEASSLTGRQHLGPRLSVGYTFANDGLLSLSHGTFYQQQERDFLLRRHDLDMTQARHTILSYLHTNKDHTLRLEAYCKAYDGLLRTTPDTANTGKGYAQGAEFFWRDRKSLKGVDYWVSYSYLDTKRQYLNYPRLTQPSFAAQHTASLVLKRFFSKLTTNVGLTYTVTTGRPYYNPARPADEFMQDRTPVYQNLGLSVAYLPKIRIRQSYSVVVMTVSNLLGNQQIYGYRYGSSSPYRSEAIKPVANPFVFLGFFLNIGTDRRQETINSQL